MNLISVCRLEKTPSLNCSLRSLKLILLRWPNISTAWLVLLRVRGVPSSNIRPMNGYRDWYFAVLLSLPWKCGTEPPIRPWPLISRKHFQFTIHQYIIWRYIVSVTDCAVKETKKKLLRMGNRITTTRNTRTTEERQRTCMLQRRFQPMIQILERTRGNCIRNYHLLGLIICFRILSFPI
jgi:hypothetical protein